MKTYSASVEADINAPQKKTFEHIVPIDLTSIFKGYGPLPAVLGTRDQKGAWNEAGQTRTVVMSDGSSAQELLTEYDYPSHFSYKVSNFKGALRAIVTSANGEWWFDPMTTSQRTHIRWTYVFTARSSFSAPIVWFITKFLWKGYMKKALFISKEQIEKLFAQNS